MELNAVAERSSAARFTARRFFEIDPQECGGLRQGNIALIHSAPTGERSQAVIASEAKQSIGRQRKRMDCFVASAPRNDGGSPQCPLWDFFIASSCSALAVPWNFDFQVS